MSESSWVLMPDSLIAEMREDYERGQGSVAAAGSVPVRWWMWARELVRLNPEGIEPEYEWAAQFWTTGQRWSKSVWSPIGGRDRDGRLSERPGSGDRVEIQEWIESANSEGGTQRRLVRRVVGPWVVVDDECG